MSKKLRIFKGRSSKGIKGIELGTGDKVISLSILDTVNISFKVAKHLITNILDIENIKYELDDVKVILDSNYPDIRRIINTAQRQSVGGELKIDTESIIQRDYKLKIFNSLKTEDKKNAFNNIRQTLATEKIRDFADLFRVLYEEVDYWGEGHIAECILIIAKYELSDAQVVDKEINVMAMIIELLGVIK